MTPRHAVCQATYEPYTVSSPQMYPQIVRQNQIQVPQTHLQYGSPIIPHPSPVCQIVQPQQNPYQSINIFKIFKNLLLTFLNSET